MKNIELLCNKPLKISLIQTKKNEHEFKRCFRFRLIQNKKIAMSITKILSHIFMENKMIKVYFRFSFTFGKLHYTILSLSFFCLGGGRKGIGMNEKLHVSLSSFGCPG